MATLKRPPTFFIGYGIGDLGLNIYWHSLSLILVFWYADIVGLDPSDAGKIFAIGVLWDAISDPLIASLAERNKSRFGTYRPFLLFGSILLGFAFAFLFWVPPLQGKALFFHLVLAHVLFRISYTIVAVPYAAMTARISYSSRERADLSGVRMAFAFIGLLAVSSFWFPLTRVFGQGVNSSPTGPFMTAIAGSVIATLALIICFAATREEPALGAKHKSNVDLIENFKKAFTENDALRILLMLIFVNSASALSLSVPLAFYIEANNGLFASKEVVFTANALITLFSVPVWALMIRRLGKKICWTIASAFLALCGLHLALYGPFIISGVPAQIALMGASASAFAILTWAIIPDTVEYGQYRYGVRAEGVVFGSVLFFQKVSQALTGLLIGKMLSLVGYDPAADTQLPEVAENLGLFLAVAPTVLALLSVLIIVKLPLSRSVHAKIVDALSEESCPSDHISS